MDRKTGFQSENRGSIPRRATILSTRKENMGKYKDISWGGCLLLALLVVAFLIVYMIVIGGVLTLLWNWLLVELFSFPVITWIHGIGIAVLLAIVGGFFRATLTSK